MTRMKNVLKSKLKSQTKAAKSAHGNFPRAAARKVGKRPVAKAGKGKA